MNLINESIYTFISITHIYTYGHIYIHIYIYMYIYHYSRQDLKEMGRDIVRSIYIYTYI
jgi:hypothetical protein